MAIGPTPREQVEQGLERHRADDLDGAAEIYRAVLAADADNADAYHFLGLVAHQKGDHQEAVRLIRSALAISSDRATFHYNLSIALAALGQWQDAETAGAAAVALESDWAEAHYNVGTALGQLKKYHEAEQAFCRAMSLQTPYPEAQSGLAAALEGQGQSSAAAAAARAALADAPDLAQAHTNLGNALHSLGEFEDAEYHHRTALAAAPGYATAHYNLAKLLVDLARLDEAHDSFLAALAIQPDYADAAHSYLLSFLYDERKSEEDIYSAHRQWGEAEAAAIDLLPARAREFGEAERRLRIGYVSADFRTHSCAYFLAPVFTGHDRDQVEVFAYANLDTPDEVTKQLRKSVDHWREIAPLDDPTVAQMIAADGIDVLIDLSGYTLGGRLGVFARRPAPVQISWLGYPATTGLTGIDFRFTDAITDPPGAADKWHTEHLIRLPHGFHCYGPPKYAPPVAPPPSHISGHITFGSFNNPHKLSAETIGLWARILAAVPDAQLLLKGRGLEHSAMADRIKHQFANHDIAPDRIQCHQWIARDAQPLSLYGNVDIALDPTPYNGTTTTLEALYMGVPVITLRGARHSSRVSASLLTQLGQADWIANTRDDYVAVAVNLANNSSDLAKYRRKLRDQLIQSPICDVQLFISALEGALRDIWRQYCRE